MPEVVVEAALADQPAADELLERADGLLLAAAAGGAHGPDVERAPDHGRRGEHLARGLADRVEAPEQQLARARGQRPRRVGVERVEVLDEQERQPFGLLVQAPGELGARAGSRRREQLADLGLAQPPEPPHTAALAALELGHDAPEAGRGRGPPGQQHEQRAAREPAQAVGEQPDRRVVGPLRVVDEEDPRRRAGRGDGERLPHAVEEARLRRRAVERRRRGGAEVGQQPRGLGERALRHRRDPGRVLAQALAQRGDERAVGERRLLLVGAAAQQRGAALAGVRDQLLGEPGLADAGLALDYGDPPVGADPAVQLHQRAPVVLAADERRGARRRLRGRRGVVRRGRALERALADRLVEPRRLGQRAARRARARACARTPGTGRAPRRGPRCGRRAGSAPGGRARGAGRARASGARGRGRPSPRPAARARSRARAAARRPRRAASPRTPARRAARSPRAARRGTPRSPPRGRRRRRARGSGRRRSPATPRARGSHGRGSRPPPPARSPSAASRACAAARRGRARRRAPATAARRARRAGAGARRAPARRAAPSPCACRTPPASRRARPAVGRGALRGSAPLRAP